MANSHLGYAAVVLRGNIHCRWNSRDWKSLPADFERDAIRNMREELRPHLRGRGNNLIKARVALASAETWEQLIAAIDMAA